MIRADYITSFQTCPIILVGGAAGAGMLPITNLLSSANYRQGLTGTPTPGESFFGTFRPMSGHNLMDNEVATYPVANQTTAANAVITQPLRLAMEMLVPAGGLVTVTNKLSIMTALKSTLDKHTSMGGWYNVATPSYIYKGCLLTSLVDASDEEMGKQVQVRWVWQFMQPLLTVKAAEAAQNQFMAKISGNTRNQGNPPGSQPLSSSLGQPSSNIVQNVVPAASSPQGSNIAPVSSSGLGPSVSSVSPITPGS